MNIDSYINSELEIKSELEKYLNQKDELVIFDIGACEGEDSIRYSRYFKHSKVFAFEPHPRNARLVEENISRYGQDNIVLVKKALSSQIGTSVFHISSGKPDSVPEEDEWNYGNKSSSLLEPDMVLKTHPWLKFETQIEVDTDTIESFCLTNKIKKIDFVHLDVQGAELMVLQGAGNYLQDIEVVWMEVEKVQLYDNQPLKADLEKFMKENEFKLVYEDVSAISGDQLYVNKRNLLKPRLERKFIELRKSLTDRFTEKYKKTSFSQSGEDLIIDYIFQCRGIQKPTYFDIGAHHPLKFNNTAIFYKKGSHGINVEPDPILFKLFEKERKRDVNLNIGVGSTNESLDFYLMTPSTLNTFSKEEADRYVEEYGFRVKEVLQLSVQTISSVLEQYFNRQFPDFLTLDVEGMEMDVLQSIDFNRARPKVICMETISYSETGRGEKNKEGIRYLEARGFMVYADTNINTIFVDKDFWQI